MMPNHPYDPTRTFKKRHIGNDYVMIVWNESTPFDFHTIPSQFNLFQIIITPLTNNDFEHSTYEVKVQTKDGCDLGMIVSGESLGGYVGQMGIFCNTIGQNESSGNAKERLRQIKRLKARLEVNSAEGVALDFTSLFA
jgi:hypothetical protein